MLETWSYDKVKRFDATGMRWHFVQVSFYSKDSVDVPYELYFRDEERTEFGVLRFERWQDNPYRDYVAVITKIMNNTEFRNTLLNPDTEKVWRKSWK